MNRAKIRYHNLPLGPLITEIVVNSDPLALEEFHRNRTLFVYKGENPILVIQN